MTTTIANLTASRTYARAGPKFLSLDQRSERDTFLLPPMMAPSKSG